MKHLILLFDYCLYKIKSTNEHGVHSPFVFDLVTQVIYNDKDYYSYKVIEAQREKLLNSNKDGQSVTESKPVKYGRLLFRLVNYFQPAHILEIGSSLGIETAYMAAASSSTKVTAFESSKEVVALAKDNLAQLKLKNVVFVNTLDSNLKSSDFVYFHKSNDKAFLNDFYRMLEMADDSSIFIVSDMYNSAEMKKAWAEIKNHERVKVSIDMFYMGIVFFRKEQVKEHFLIRF